MKLADSAPKTDDVKPVVAKAFELYEAANYYFFTCNQLLVLAQNQRPITKPEVQALYD